MLNLSAR